MEYINDIILEIEEALENVEYYEALNLFEELSKFINHFYKQIGAFNAFIKGNKYEKLYKKIAEALFTDLLSLLKETKKNLTTLKKTFALHTFPLEYHYFFVRHLVQVERFIENFEGPNRKLFHELKQKIETEHEDALLKILGHL